MELDSNDLVDLALVCKHLNMNSPLSVELKELHIIVLISFTKNIQKNHSQVFTRFITDLLPPYFYILASALKAAIAIERDHLFHPHHKFVIVTLR